MSLPAPLGRNELIDHLTRTKIAGDVATPREVNLRNYRELTRGNLRYWLGLQLGDRWTSEADVLAVMAERAGVSPDPGHTRGQDRIDPELTVDGLHRMATALRKAAAGRQRVLVATGHPGGLLEVHSRTAAALRAAGCEIVSVPAGLYAEEGDDASWGNVQQFCDVAVLERGATLWHTHAPQPMTQILDALERAGDPPPDLVVADHGWAGCAAQRGIDTVGYADSNDPALFLGEAEGTVAVTVPLDDHVIDWAAYAPMTAYLLAAAGLTTA